MTLIERAAQRLGMTSRQPGTRCGATDGGDPDDQPADAGSGPNGLPIQPRAGERRSRPFEVDFARLGREGYITPSRRRSRLSEEMRLIKRRLLKRVGPRPEGRAQVFMITSARPDEGKSFLALNLSLSLAIDEGLNVLLADADPAQPSLLKALRVEADLGLTDVLRDPSMDLGDVLLRAENVPLALLPQGSRVASATELFGSEAMGRLVDEMACRYHDRLIIFDTPPLLATTEPVVLANHMGQIVIVVQAGKTSGHVLGSALDLLDQQENVSLVLNRCTMSYGGQRFGSYHRGDA